MHDLPNVSPTHLERPDPRRLRPGQLSTHPPRILLLYGSLREHSYSRFLTLEAERLLRHFGAETRVYDPHGLPLPDGAPADHPRVAELREQWLRAGARVRTGRLQVMARAAACASTAPTLTALRRLPGGPLALGPRHQLCYHGLTFISRNMAR